jgi:SAM-dependent methyltransferase
MVDETPVSFGSIGGEPFLEPVLRWMRIRKILPFVGEGGRRTVLDLGCGPRFTLLRALSRHVQCGVGVDEHVEETCQGNIRTYRARLETVLPFEEGSFDVVTMLAVLEHLATPLEILREVRRVLRPQGVLLITVPSPAAKPLLEFLSFRLHLVSEKEIRDHKTYYDREMIGDLLAQAGIKLVRHRYFQFGFNNFAVATKKTM